MRKYTKEWLIELCQSSYSYAEVLRKAGRKSAGGSYEILKKKILEFNINIDHFTGAIWSHSPNSTKCRKSKEKYKVNNILTEHSTITQKVLRGYIKRHNLLEYKCEKCGCTGNWQDGTISLELDHIDGDNTNNKIENLRYLCPNCHALTTTYRGRNKKRVETIHQPPKS